MTSEAGSFAEKTIVERKPQILREVGRAHPYPPDILAALDALTAEIVGAPIQPLSENAPDVELWNKVWRQYRGRTWRDAPWYWAETFFYRRLMQAVRFYQPGPWRDVDPFAPQKAAQLTAALPTFVALLQRPQHRSAEALSEMLHDALWGNRADLSNRTVTARADDGLAGRQTHRLLIDDSARIWTQITGAPPGRIDIIHDNSGLELLLDLRLADFLLQTNLAQEVRLHLKQMPFFISDAMRRDLEHTLDRLAAHSPPGKALAQRLRAAMDENRLTVRDDPFWSSCFSYRRLPPRIHAELAQSRLTLLKGDVNYRRLLDDRHWPYTAHLSEIAADFPAPFVALRTLKGELIVDLQPGQAEALRRQDPTWMINGKRGVIQLVEHNANLCAPDNKETE